MSNQLAVANVTAALWELLQIPVSKAVTGANVVFSGPKKAANGTEPPTVGIFLYQTTPNAAYRNADLPTRRSDGTLVQRPQAAIDLHYLFTFHGDDKALEPQRMFGVVTRILQAQPLLSKQLINQAVLDYGFLKGSNLAEQVESIRFTQAHQTLEELSKLWSMFFEVEFSLSAVYEASVVLIESDDPPQQALPVQARNIYAVPFRGMSVTRVISQAGADQPIVAGSTLLIEGQQLRGDLTIVLLENKDLSPATVSDSQVTLPLPADVNAGLRGLQIVHRMLLGTPPALHRGFESNVAAFVLHPTITLATSSPAADPPGSFDVTLTLDPHIGAGQRAMLVLNSLPGVPVAAYTSLPVIAAAAGPQVTINIAGAPSGSYLVRVQIDGAESLLTMGANGMFNGPVVNL